MSMEDFIVFHNIRHLFFNVLFFFFKEKAIISECVGK